MCGAFVSPSLVAVLVQPLLAAASVEREELVPESSNDPVSCDFAPQVGGRHPVYPSLRPAALLGRLRARHIPQHPRARCRCDIPHTPVRRPPLSSESSQIHSTPHIQIPSQNDEPDFLSYPWPSVSEPAKDLIRKCLQKDPKARVLSLHPSYSVGFAASPATFRESLATHRTSPHVALGARRLSPWRADPPPAPLSPFLFSCASPPRLRCGTSGCARVGSRRSGRSTPECSGGCAPSRACSG